MEIAAKVLHHLGNVDGHGAGEVEGRAAREGNVHEVLVLKLGGYLPDGALVVEHIDRLLSGDAHLVDPHAVGEGNLAAVHILVQRLKLLGADDRGGGLDKDILAVLGRFQRLVADGGVADSQIRVDAADHLAVGAFDRLDDALHLVLSSGPTGFGGDLQLVSVVLLLNLEGCDGGLLILDLGAQAQLVQMLVGQRSKGAINLLDVQRVNVGLTRQQQLVKFFLAEGELDLLVGGDVDRLRLLRERGDAHGGQRAGCQKDGYKFFH